jgi:hypothetical protein
MRGHCAQARYVGTWQSNSSLGGGLAAAARRVTWSSAVSSPPPGQPMTGFVRETRWSNSRDCVISPRPWRTLPPVPIAGLRGHKARTGLRKTSTDLARRFDMIRVEDLRVVGMTRSARGTLTQPGRNVRQKAGLNREILASGWGLLVRRLRDKAPGRVESVSPAYTSQRCSACGHVDADANGPL